MTDLLDTIDEAASDLLARAKADDAAIPLVERVKAFEAVAKWAELRIKIAPQEKKEPTIVSLQRRLNGGADKRGRTRPTSVETAPDSSGNFRPDQA